MAILNDPYAPSNIPGKGYENDPEIKNNAENGGKENAPIEVPDQNQTPQNIPAKS